ncbi:MAG TPA: HAD family hydrolase [Acidimicrobiia bacterium]
MTTSKRISAVTFDYWNTLAHEQRGHLRDLRLGAWASILRDAGVEVTRAALEDALAATWESYLADWTANHQFDAVAGARAGIAHLGIDVAPSVATELIEAFTDAGANADLSLTPHIDGVLDEMARCGVRLGIVCDVGITGSQHLRAFLDRAGVLEHFDHWSFSDEVGVYKPDRRIFEHALDGLGVNDPSEAAHVGDLRRTDVAGARAMGMISVRYRGVFDDAHQPAADQADDQHPDDRARAGAVVTSPPDAPEGHHVLDDHRQLSDALGLL